MLKAFVIIATICAFSANAGAISRSGGGKLRSTELGFSATAPEFYPQANPLVNNGVRLWSSLVFGGAKMSLDSFLELRDFGSEFPEMNKGNRASLKTEFTKMNWKQKPHSEVCADVYEHEGTNVRSVAIVWGPERGVVILGGFSKVAQRSIDEIVQTLTLEPGSCSW